MKVDIRSKVGRRLRFLRTSHGWSQEKLAEKTGLHPTYIGGIERGERNVSLCNLDKLAQAFSFPLAKFFQFCDGREARCTED